MLQIKKKQQQQRICILRTFTCESSDWNFINIYCTFLRSWESNWRLPALFHVNSKQNRFYIFISYFTFASLHSFSMIIIYNMSIKFQCMKLIVFDSQSTLLDKVWISVYYSTATWILLNIILYQAISDRFLCELLVTASSYN